MDLPLGLWALGRRDGDPTLVKIHGVEAFRRGPT